jgi:hypothetical protein
MQPCHGIVGNYAFVGVNFTRASEFSGSRSSQLHGKTSASGPNAF